MVTQTLPPGWELTASAFNWTAEVLRAERDVLDVTAGIVATGITERIEVEAGQLWRTFPRCDDRESEEIRERLAQAGGSISQVGLGLDDWITETMRRTEQERFEFLVPQIRAAARSGATGIRLPLGQAGPGLVQRLLPLCEDLDLVLYEEAQGPQRVAQSPQSEAFETIAAIGNPRFRALIDISMLMPSLPPSYLDVLARAGLPHELVEQLRSEWGAPETVDAARAFLLAGRVPPEIHAIYMNLFVRFGTSHARDLRDVLPIVGGIHLKFWDLDDREGRISQPITELARELHASGFQGTLCSEWGGHEWLPELDATDMTRAHLALAHMALASGANT